MACVRLRGLQATRHMYLLHLLLAGTMLSLVACQTRVQCPRFLQRRRRLGKRVDFLDHDHYFRGNPRLSQILRVRTFCAAGLSICKVQAIPQRLPISSGLLGWIRKSRFSRRASRF